MAWISGNYENSSRDFGDSSKLTNWILDSWATFHMTPKASDFIPGLFKYMDKYIEVMDKNYVTEKQEVKVQIKICDDNGSHLIATLHNVILLPYLCNMVIFKHYIIESRT